MLFVFMEKSSATQDHLVITIDDLHVKNASHRIRDRMLQLDPAHRDIQGFVLVFFSADDDLNAQAQNESWIEAFIDRTSLARPGARERNLRIA